jgi:hypothetical protein
VRRRAGVLHTHDLSKGLVRQAPEAVACRFT